VEVLDHAEALRALAAARAPMTAEDHARALVALLDGGRMQFQGTPEAFNRSENPMVRAFRDSAATLRDTLAALRRGETITSEDDL
jgi:hypothetical protein